MLNKDRRPKSRVNQEGAHMKMDEYRTKRRKNMSLNLTMESEKKNIDQLTKKEAYNING